MKTPDFSKKRYLLLATLVVVVAVAVGAAKFVLPGFMKKEILKAVDESCADCVLSMKSVDVSLMHPGLFTFHDIRFAGGQGGKSLVEVRIAELYVDLKIGRSNREQLVFDRIEAFGAEIIYSDGDAKEIEKPEKQKSDHPLKFAALNVELHSAQFRYVHTEDKRTSILHFHDIDAKFTNIGNTSNPDTIDKMAEARLTGQIEKSGSAELVIAALLRPGPFHVDSVFTLEKQNMSDLNTFFTHNDGIVLKGVMIKAVAKVEVRGQSSKSHIEASYKDADFKQKPIKDKGVVEAALTTLGADLLMTKTNVDHLLADRTAEGEIKREPAAEPLVHFILRSMKLGLLEVAKKKDSRK